MSASFPPPLSEADYEAIAAAVMETSRGRWFLSEYARRNRHADTEMLLGAIERLGNAVSRQTAAPIDHVRQSLVSLTEAIDQTRSRIAALGLELADGREGTADVFEAIPRASQKSTLDVMIAAEGIQEIAWTLREQGADVAACDALDAHTGDIHLACAVQDLTDERTRKLVQLLRLVERRLGELSVAMGVEPSVPIGLSIEVGEAEEPALPTPADAYPPSGDIIANPPTLVPAEIAADAPSSPGSVEAASERPDPLAPLKGLSREETIALFS